MDLAGDCEQDSSLDCRTQPLIFCRGFEFLDFTLHLFGISGKYEKRPCFFVLATDTDTRSHGHRTMFSAVYQVSINIHCISKNFLGQLVQRKIVLQ